MKPNEVLRQLISEESGILHRVRSDLGQAIYYLNDHEIVRAYRATERAAEELDRAIALAEAEE